MESIPRLLIASFLLNKPMNNSSKFPIMKIKFITVSLFSIVAALHPVVAADNWPTWRGPLGNGVAPQANPPLEWSETKNVKWKTRIPGRGTSTPVVWGDRVFILTAVVGETPPETKAVEAAVPAAADGAPGEGGRRRGGFGRGEKPSAKHRFTVLCIDRKTGQTLWEQVAREEVPHEGHHQDHGFASASPVTDGEVVLAYFGSRGLYCYDMQGKLKWSKDFGDMITRNSFGEGASPALYGNTVVVNWDDEKNEDFIVALDKHTGKELWKNKRDEPTNWSTPYIVKHGDQVQVIVNGTQVRSYDLATGKELWACGGIGSNPVPTPVVGGDTVYVMSGHRDPKLMAIALGREGNLTGTDAVRWSHSKNTPYVPSPVLVGDLLFFISGNTGKLSCFDAKTGKPHYEAEQLEGIFGTYASLVSVGDRLYVLGREGKCLVLKNGSKVDLLATNKLDDRTDASMAVAGKELFIRGHQNLYCIAE